MGKPAPDQFTQAANGPAKRRMTLSEWLHTLKVSWQTTLSFDMSSLTPFQALRSTLGVGIPLLLGLLTGQVETGILVSSGALMLGSVGLKDPYQKRSQTMGLACVFVTLSALVGGVVGGLGWLPVLIAIGLWGLVAGMFASISQASQVVAIQACSALIVYTHLGLDPMHALLVAGAVGLGTLLQFFLAVVPSPWTNTLPERSALASIYQKMAEAAAHPSEGQMLQISEALLNGHNTLISGNTHSERGQMFAHLLEEAEHLRMILFVLRREQQAYAQLKDEASAQKASMYLNTLIQQSSTALEVIALELHTSSSALIKVDSQQCFTHMKKTVNALQALAQETEQTTRLQQTLPYCTALLGELHIARRLASSWRRARSFWPLHIHFPYPRPRNLRLEDIRTNLRANLTPRSSAFRHAVRLSVALLLATLLYQVFHLSVARGYWIPMTVALVLRADFTTTFTRGIARLVGTTLGALLTTLLVLLLLPSSGLLAAFIILGSYLMFATLFANYAIFSIGTTMAVVCLLAFINAPTGITALDRALDTLVGGLLALIVYALWPTWEQTQVPEYIARRLETLGLYLYAILSEYAVPGTCDLQEREKRHQEARLARSNARGSVQRSLQEPRSHRINAELAEGLLVATDNISRSALTLEAYLRDYPDHEALPAAQDFARTLEGALDSLATAIRTHQPLTHTPDLAASFQTLKTSARATKRLQPTDQAICRFVVHEAKRITSYVQAMQQSLASGSFV